MLVAVYHHPLALCRYFIRRRHSMSNAIYGPVPNPYPPLNNKYYKWYMNICRSRQQLGRKKGKGLTKHHIIPDSFFIIRRSKKYKPGWLIGNSNIEMNLVYLTHREHSLCHWLLTKIYHGIANQKMHNAFQRIHNGNKSSRYYDISRNLYSDNSSGANNVNWKGKTYSKICAYCNKDYKSRNIKSSYCSLSCSSSILCGENHHCFKEKIELVCKNCNKTYKVRPSIVKNSNFCSKRCTNIGTKSRIWTFIDPFGIKITFINLNDFCRNHQLSREKMSKLYRGIIKTYKGWKRYE